MTNNNLDDCTHVAKEFYAEKKEKELCIDGHRCIDCDDCPEEKQVIDKEINITKDDKGYNKQRSLEDYINDYGYNDNGTPDSDVLEVTDVQTALTQLQKRIRELPNRDDKIHSQLKILDGGGVGRFEVLEIIKQEMGKSLCEVKE